MKKLLLVVALVAVSAVSLIAQDHFSRDVIFISENGGVVSLKSTGTSREKKEAVKMAIKSAFDTYIFAGIAGLGDEQPKVDESMRSKKADYFHRLYNEDRYAVFVKEFQEVGKVQKNDLGFYTATVVVAIYRNALDRDLNTSKVVEPKEVTTEELEDAMIVPSIMVVPYKLSSERYKDILEHDFDKRVAVAKVQEGFQDQNIETVDFEAKHNAALRSLEFEAEMADAFDAQLIKNSGADVYVTVDIKKTNTYNNSKVILTLKAYETATARVLASKDAAIAGSSSTDFAYLCALAIKKVSREFVSEIKKEFNEKTQKGGTVMLRVSIAGSSYKSLDDPIDEEYFGISDYIRSWLRKNAVGGRFHLQGKTDLAMIFDEIKIPNKNADGDLQDAADFATRLTRFLKKKGVNASNRIDGATIYITISD